MGTVIFSLLISTIRSNLDGNLSSERCRLTALTRLFCIDARSPINFVIVLLRKFDDNFRPSTLLLIVLALSLDTFKIEFKPTNLAGPSVVSELLQLSFGSSSIELKLGVEL